MKNANSRPSRPGWTRVEVVVVAVVVLTVVGLVVSVVQRSRGAAERVECAMHFQRLGKAIQGFHDEHKTLPASCIAPGYATWAVQIAPFLQQEQSNKLKSWDLKASYYEQSAEVRESQLWVFFCPARRYPPQLSTSGEVPVVGASQLANYAGALGDYGCAPTSDNTAKPWTSPDADGALVVAEVLQKDGDKIVRWKSRTNLAMLERGEKYTILLGEKHVPLEAFGQTRLGDGSIYNGDYQPSFARIIDKEHGLAQEASDSFKNNFGSWHPGVCQFLMADGSLQVFANSVSPLVVQKLIPRSQ